MAKTKKHEKKSKKKHKDNDRGRVSKKSKKSKKSHKKDKAKKETVDKQEFEIPLELMNNKSHAPETPEEYQKRQSQIRREKDPITGRMRLIKGDGEVLEEIVSKSQHAEINKLATRGDGKFYEEKSGLTAAKKKY